MPKLVIVYLLDLILMSLIPTDTPQDAKVMLKHALEPVVHIPKYYVLDWIPVLKSVKGSPSNSICLL